MTEAVVEPSDLELQAAIDGYANVHNSCGFNLVCPRGMNKKAIDLIFWKAMRDALVAAAKVRAESQRGEGQ